MGIERPSFSTSAAPSLIPISSHVRLASKPASAINNTDSALRSALTGVAWSLSSRALATSSSENRAVLAMESPPWQYHTLTVILNAIWNYRANFPKIAVDSRTLLDLPERQLDRHAHLDFGRIAVCHLTIEASASIQINHTKYIGQFCFHST